MTDYEFECFEGSRNWADFSYNENWVYLVDMTHLKYSNENLFFYLLSLSKDAFLVKKGYYKHPLRIKRTKFQKLTKKI